MLQQAADLNPDTTSASEGEGVYYQVVNEADPRVAVFNRLTVEWQVPVFGTENLCHFETILMADGSVIMQYSDMPAEGGWSTPSIGFEDRTGSAGVQILYGEVPPARTAYRIPPACHSPRAGGGGRGSCESQCDSNYGAGTPASCACASGCAEAAAGANFFACSHTCNDAYSAGGDGCGCEQAGACEDSCNGGCSLGIAGR